MPAPAVDAVLVAAFGGPESLAEVAPFLRRVAHGRDIPPDRLAEVARHYEEQFGGVSPGPRQMRDLAAALQAELAHRGQPLPVYLGFRNSPPLFADVLTRLAVDGRRHALVLLASAYPSYSGCRQYQDELAIAAATVPGAPRLTRLRHFYAEPGFLAAVARAARAQLTDRSRLVFTAHSLPVAQARAAGPAGDGYVTTLRHAAQRVAELLDAPEWDLAFQSRSGRPGDDWLEPDVGDHLVELHRQGCRDVVLVPIGFISDNAEVRYDLDVAAAQRAERLPGLRLRRAATAGTDPDFVAALAEVALQRLSRSARSDHGAPATHDVCPAGCCRPADQLGRP